MFSRPLKFAMVAALACSLGLHWAFFQSVAWAGMILSYSQQAPLREALAKTFDGKHPCCLCKQIAREKQAEKKAALPDPVKKLEFSHCPAVFVFRAPAFFYEADRFVENARSSHHEVPHPPPRLLPM